MRANSRPSSWLSYGGASLLGSMAWAVAAVSLLADDKSNLEAPKSGADVQPSIPRTQPAPANQKFYVAGSVFDEATKQPVAKATLRFLIPGVPTESQINRTVTDGQGRFRMEVPPGIVVLWMPELKPGYWLETAASTQTVVTTPEKPVATLDIAAKPGAIWPVRLVVENGLPEKSDPYVTVGEVEDDAARFRILKSKLFNTEGSEPRAIALLDDQGRGAFTQCGKSGKLLLHVGVDFRAMIEVDSLISELIIESGFDNRNVNSATPIAGTDKVELVDEAGKKAVMSRAEVTIQNGRPLITFRLKRRLVPRQEYFGRVVSSNGEGLPGVRVRFALGSSREGSSMAWPGSVQTDEQGRFRIQVPLDQAGGMDRLNFVLNKKGYVGIDSAGIDLPKRIGAAKDAGEFSLERGKLMAVRVVDEDGKPVIGAGVEHSSGYAAGASRTRTDADGRVILRDLPTGVVPVFAFSGDKHSRTKLIVSSVDSDNPETTLQIRKHKRQNAPSVSRKRPDPIKIGTMAPELAIEKWSDGKSHTLASYRGKIIVLDFWAVWCGPCVRSIPMMQQLADKYEPKGVVFLGVHTPDGEMELINRLKKLKGWKCPTGIARDPNSGHAAESIDLYGVNGVPTLIVIDSLGKVAFTSDVRGDQVAEFQKEIEKLALSLKIPWPLPEKSEAETELLMMRLLTAFYSQQIDKALAAEVK